MRRPVDVGSIDDYRRCETVPTTVSLWSGEDVTRATHATMAPGSKALSSGFLGACRVHVAITAWTTPTTGRHVILYIVIITFTEMLCERCMTLHQTHENTHGLSHKTQIRYCDKPAVFENCLNEAKVLKFVAAASNVFHIATTRLLKKCFLTFTRQ